MSSTYLVVDARERAVVPFLETELTEHAFIERQINTGDYLVCRAGEGGAPPTIQACIERKTLADFAASFKDGRYENVKKMRELRVATGCQLYYFIEGPAFPAPSRRFARIPYSSILAAMTKLSVRDGVFIVLTKDESHTAKRLADFLHVFGAGPVAAPAVENGAAGGCDAPVAADIDASTISVPDIVTAQVPVEDTDAVVAMWARLRGVSVVLGKIISREFSAADLSAGRVSVERIRAFRTATGRRINKDALASLLAVRAESSEHEIKIVSGLKGVTPAVAEIILTSVGGLAKVISASPAALADVMLPQKGRSVRLGLTRAGRMLRVLNFVEGAAGVEHDAAGVENDAAGVEHDAAGVEHDAAGVENDAAGAAGAAPATQAIELADSDVDELLGL